MESEEKKEITVEDRRHFDSDGNPVNSSPSETNEKEKVISSDDVQEKEDTAFRQDLPPLKVDFTSILFSYIHAALVYLGDTKDADTSTEKPNLEAVRQMIDVLELLQAKTKGNLTNEEALYLENALFDLRMRYVQKAGQSQ